MAKLTEQEQQEIIRFLEAGKPLNGPRYERAMLLLSDLHGHPATAGPAAAQCAAAVAST